MGSGEIRCSPQLYAKISLAAAESYIKGVLDGTIPANKWIKAAVERGIEDRKSDKYDLEYDKVSEVFEFCSRLNIQNHKGKTGQFILSPYQTWMLMEMFLYYEKDDGARRFTEIIYFTARKSGKTMIAAIISFYLSLLGGYVAPQVYFAASGVKQATNLLNYCKEVSRYSRFLECRLEPKAFEIKTKDSGIFVAVANKTGGELDGFRPLVAVLDECHALKGNDLRNAFMSGMGWSTDTLFISISTAGTNTLSFFHDQIKMAKKALEIKEFIDDKTLYFLYTLDDGDLQRDDITTNKDLWLKANPNLGVTPPLKRYIADMNKAWPIAEEKQKFIIKNFNVFDDEFSVTKLFSMHDINRNTEDLNIEDFYGATIYLGLDLAPKIDISALGVLMEKDGKFYSWSDMFCAGAKEAIMRRGTTMNLAEYSDHININWHKPTTDYEAILDKIRFYSENFNVVAVGFDPAYSGTMASSIERMGVDTFPVKQYHAAFNEVIMFMENLLAVDEITFDSNPLLRYMFSNTLVDENNQGMRMPAKKESKINGDAIDAVMAILMAFNMYFGHNVETSAIYQYLQGILHAKN